MRAHKDNDCCYIGICIVLHVPLSPSLPPYLPPSLPPSLPSFSESQASLGFGVVTVIAGLVGTVSGSELSKFLSRWTDQADCIVCAFGLLVGSPLMYFTISFSYINIYLGWVRGGGEEEKEEER